MRKTVVQSNSDSHSERNVSNEEYDTCCCCGEPAEHYMLPRLGEQAPKFEAVTTQGTINFPDDYAGKWIVFFSHPADFTPVCTSEFITMASMQKQFEARNTQLVGLSVDGLYSHIAWLRTIREKIEYKGLKNIEVTFPLIADAGMEIAQLYGMLQPDESESKAVRALFFIDPHGIIRAMIYYPLVLGRNFQEILRVIVALQTADAYKLAMPANWQPGDEAIVPTPGSCGVANERMGQTDPEVSCQDWFFCTKKLSIEQVNNPPAPKIEAI